MDITDFKEFRPQNKRSRSLFNRSHLIKTLVAMAIGAAIAFVVFYFNNRQSMDEFQSIEAFKSMIFGALFGIFVTNSPCAKGKC